MLVKKIGFEFEFFVGKYINGQNELVFPEDYGFSTDEFTILGEERTEASTNTPDLMGDFYKKWYRLQELAYKNKLIIYTDGFTSITPEFYAEILRRMGGKEISTCRNIYRTDILKMTDAIVEDGVIKSYYISTGLHLHFSFQQRVEYQYPKLVKIKDKYVHLGEYETRKAKENVLPEEWMKKIIRGYDKIWLKTLTKDYPRLKFRQPGFYETKPWGFEYRSLPFSYKSMANLPQILVDGFKFLDQIKFV